MISQKIHPKCRARREIYRRRSRRHFVRCKQRSAIQLQVRSDMSADGENPFQPHWIHSCPVRGVCRLEHNKRRHRLHCKLESSVEKSRPVRSCQDPSVANSRVQHARIFGPARNRAPTASPNLEFMTTLLRAILGNRKRSCKEQCQDKGQKKTARTPNGSCHKYGESRKRTIREPRPGNKSSRYSVCVRTGPSLRDLNHFYHFSQR